jgi:methionine synthase I (cobalamin-dependent)
MAYGRLKRRLDAGEVVILDGATGTELQRRGAPMDPAAWCGPATLHNDQLLTQIHADYIAAGAEVITANTFASSRLMLSRAGYGDRVEEINRRAVEAALRARDGVPGGAEVVVAGSLSHMVPVTEGTAVVDPKSLPDDAEMAAAFSELARILATAGCNLIILEMMYHPRRVPLALRAALATGLPVWFGLSARRGKDGRVVSFHQTEDLPLDEIAGLIPDQGVDAAGAMHTGADLIGEALESVRRRFDGPLMAYPDSGYFEMPDWRFVDVVAPQRFEAFCRDWIESGVQILGGCCGLTVEHIEAAVRARDAATD